MDTSSMETCDRAPQPHPLTIGLIALVYFLTAKLGLTLDAVNGFAAIVWPPSGIALAAVVLLGPRVWPGIALAAFAINASVGAPWLAAAGIAGGNTLEALLGACWLRWSGFRPEMDRVEDVLQLALYSGVLSTIIAATVGTTSLWLAGVLSLPSFEATWQAWWAGDMLGVLIVAPPLLAWGSDRGLAFRPLRIVRTLPCLALLAVTCVIVFGGMVRPPSTSAIAYLIFPALIWAALQFTPRGAATAVLAMSGIAVWGAMRGTAPFLAETVTLRLLLLQFFMGVASLTTLILAAAVAQRRESEAVARASEQALRQTHDQLEGRVRARTLELSQANTALQQGREQLDQRVQERTAELAKANTLLKTSLDARREVEEELRRVQNELERRVAERTASLATATMEVQAELVERKRMEAQLRNQTRILESILENLVDGVVVCNEQGRVILFNSAAERILGTGAVHAPPSEWTERFGCFLPDGATPCPTDALPLVRAMRGESVDEAEIVIHPAKRPEATLLSVTARPLRLKHDGSIVVGALAVFRDVTERKRIMEALRASEEQFRAVVETAREAIISANTQGRIISWNRGAEAIFGYSEPEVVGQPLTILMPERFRTAHSRGIHRLASGGPSAVMGKTIELEGLRKDGIEFPLELSLSTWNTSQGNFFTAIIRDITERKQVEHQLTRTNELLVKNQTELLDTLVKFKHANAELQATQLQLFQAAKLESVGRLAAGVAHEVKNPLATLLIGIDHLADHMKIGNGDVALLLQDMQRAVRKADTVIKGLLDFSTPETLELAEEDVHHVLEQAAELMTHEFARNHVTVVKRWAPEVPRIRLDHSKIEQVLVNLFMNAVHAMPNGGMLTVQTAVKHFRSSSSTRSRRQHDLFQLGGTVVVVTVDDTGSGIPPEKLPKIFDPFFTTKPTGQGTGLGLTVSRKIVELHGGTLEIHNRPEGGVRATLMFSAAERRGETCN